LAFTRDRIFIGTSGWSYAEWKTLFYSSIPQRSWLRHYATRFGAVEVNATFYHLLRASTFERWRDETPEGFRFAIKGNRFLTHRKRLADPAVSIAKDRERASALGEKLAVVLWQTPRSLPSDIDSLKAFLDALASWPEARHAVEFRHERWFTDDVAVCLAASRVAACQSDAADWPLWDAVTTDLAYVRLHGHERTYCSAYSAQQLSAWARRVRLWRGEGRDVHVYFDNTADGAAVRDAERLRAMLGEGP
jgi:uncharacterized protein YecE (DUF72 family)